LRIFVFGSVASGRAVKGTSDVDLFVVVPDDSESSYDKTVKAYESLGRMHFPKDILVRHQSDFERKRGWQSSIEREVAETGRVLFERG
jgi:predicted nucleotidyltransferase